MKTNFPTQNNSFYRLLCSLTGHKYRLSKQVTHHIREYKCSHCGQEVTTHTNGRLQKMTPLLKDINSTLAYVHAKKTSRKTSLI